MRYIMSPAKECRILQATPPNMASNIPSITNVPLYHPNAPASADTYVPAMKVPTPIHAHAILDVTNIQNKHLFPLTNLLSVSILCDSNQKLFKIYLSVHFDQIPQIHSSYDHNHRSKSLV